MSSPVKEKIDDLTKELSSSDQVMEGSLAIHRFLCRNGFVPRTAIQYALLKWGKIMVWAGEAVRATGKGPADLFKVFSPTHDIGLKKEGWMLSVNRMVSLNGDNVEPTPGSLKDGSIIYALPPARGQTIDVMPAQPVVKAEIISWPVQTGGSQSNDN